MSADKLYSGVSGDQELFVIVGNSINVKKF